MAVAKAAASDHQLVDGVVVLLQHVEAPIQQVVPQSVELGEVDAQVGDSQKLCRIKKKRLMIQLYTYIKNTIKKCLVYYMRPIKLVLVHV